MIEISHKINALDIIRSQLEQDLMMIQEEELELDDECKTDFPDAHLFMLISFQ